MNDSQSRLDRILQIPILEQRRQELERFAEEVGVFHLKKGSARDLYNEERLVLAIYDGLVEKDKDRIKSRNFVIKIFFIFIILISLVAVVPRKMISYFRLLAAANNERLKSFEGYDEEGDIVRDEVTGQPVIFHEMDGYYDEYYNDGNLHYTFLYKEGKVVEEVEYDRRGRIIAHIAYDEEGYPSLMRNAE